jgi:hypothetical protein
VTLNLKSESINKSPDQNKAKKEKGINMIMNLQKKAAEHLSMSNQISIDTAGSNESLNVDLFDRTESPTMYALEHGGVKSPLQ